MHVYITNKYLTKERKYTNLYTAENLRNVFECVHAEDPSHGQVTKSP